MKLPFFSYGRFLINNPNANRKARLKALKLFLDITRQNNKIIK